MNNRNSNAKKNSMCSSIASEMSMASTTSLSSDGDGDGNGNVEAHNVDGSTSQVLSSSTEINNKTRKKREELSISATKSIKKEKVEIVVNFN